MDGRKTVLLLRGKWREGNTGIWSFEVEKKGNTKAIWLSSRSTFDYLEKMVKEKMDIKEDRAVEITYQWPQYMLMDEGRDAPPVLVQNDDDVSLFVEMRCEIDQLNLCVTLKDTEIVENDVDMVDCFNAGKGMTPQKSAMVLFQNPEEKVPDTEIEALLALNDLDNDEEVPEDLEEMEDMAILCLDGEDIDKGKGVDTSANNSDEEWHEFAVDENDEKNPAAGFKSDNGEYNSGEEADEEPESSTQQSKRFSCAKETIDGVFEDTEDPPAMFGRDAPPIVDELPGDGIDDALDDVSYEGVSIFVGRIFRNKAECKLKMALHAINKKFHFKTPRSSPTYMEFVCISDKCHWRVYASMMDRTGNFQIKTANFKHTCSIDDRRQYHRQATTQVIGELIRTRFTDGRKGPGPIEIQRIMQEDFQVNISYWKAWRCRELAMEKSLGSVSGSFALLPSYVENLKNSNPGTVCETLYEVDKNGSKRFKYLFLSFAPSIAGLKYLRPVLLIDGTHLAGRYGGCLLAASAQDGNFQIFPIAYGVVDSENDASYVWFFQCLKQIINDSSDLMFVSDRHSSIYKGLRQVYPQAGHGACLVHLVRNVTTKFRESRLPSLVVRAAKAYTVLEFSQIFAELQSVNPECAQYLLDVELPHWTRSYCMGERYNLMTTNVAESLNKVLKECREFPLISMLEAIRMSLISWFVRRKAAASSDDSILTPKVRELLDVNFTDSTNMKVII